MMSREGPVYMGSNGVPFRMGPNGPEPMHMIQGPRPGMEHLRPPMGPPMSMGDMGGPGPISPGPMSGHGPGGPQPHSPMGSQPGTPMSGTVPMGPSSHPMMDQTFGVASPVPSPGFPQSAPGAFGGPSPVNASFGGPSPHQQTGRSPHPQSGGGPPSSFGGPSPAHPSYGSPSSAHPGFGAPSPHHGHGGPGGPLHTGIDKLYPPDQPMVFNPQNPSAPPIYPCGICHKEVAENDQAILCESGCNFWFHRVCTGLAEAAFLLLTREIYAEWVCDNCFNDSKKNVPLVKFKA